MGTCIQELTLSFFGVDLDMQIIRHAFWLLAIFFFWLRVRYVITPNSGHLEVSSFAFKRNVEVSLITLFKNVCL